MSTTLLTEAPAPSSAAAALRPDRRLVSLDAFRGLTIVGMILVNNPGSWSHIYPPLRHADWHGWTPTDLIFPFFLFIVGVSIVLAFTRRLEQGVERRELLRKTGGRALVIFGLGLFLAGFPFFDFSPSFGLSDRMYTLRIMGVLQRIALCYAAAALIFLYARPRAQLVWTAALLVGYWLLMTLVPVPGVGAGRLDAPETTLAGWLDGLILGAHNYRQATWDPEGLLSTLPALATTLLGVWAGRLLVSPIEPVERTVGLFVRGVGLVVLGYVWSWFFPINKPIWTSSYAVFTAGLALCGFGLCYWAADVQGRRKWAFPFVVYGVNAITVFFLSGILGRLLGIIRVPGEGGASVSLQAWLFERVFLPLASPVNASLLYALVWIGGWYLVLLWMYRRKIFIKV